MSFPTFSGLFLSLAITLCIICSFLTPTVNASLQQITFFENPGCSGDKTETFTSPQDELETTWVANASSMHILGLWSVTIQKEMEGGAFYGTTFYHFNTNPPQGLCVDKATLSVPDPENYQFYYADPRGPADMTTSQIIFYTRPLFQGLEYIADKNKVEKLSPRPFAMMSVLKYSNDSWIAYPQANFNGGAMQFRSENVPKDYFQYSDFFVGIIGSVKKEMLGEDDKAAGCIETVNVVVFILPVLASIFKNVM